MNNSQPASVPFNSNKVLSKAIIITASFLALFYLISALSGMVSSDGESEFESLLAFFNLIFGIVGYILFFIWVNFSNKNLSFFNVGKEFSSGWAVGWFFIPIMNLVKPYYIIEEIWECSSKFVIRSNGVDYSKNKPSGFVGVWWASAIISTTLDRAVTKMSIKDSFSGTPLTAGLEVLSSITLVIFSILTAVLVYKITKFQNQKYESIIAPKEDTFEFDNINNHF